MIKFLTYTVEPHLKNNFYNINYFSSSLVIDKNSSNNCSSVTVLSKVEIEYNESLLEE